jgi:hypothetical protein
LIGVCSNDYRADIDPVKHFLTAVSCLRLQAWGAFHFLGIVDILRQLIKFVTMESSHSVRQRFLDYYFQKLSSIDAAFRRGQDDTIQAIALLNDDLAQIMQAKGWINQ